LVDRFRDGKTQGSYGTGFGPSTERLIYMTSHLDTEVETPQRLIHEARRNEEVLPEFVSKDWTMNLDQVSYDLSEGPLNECANIEKSLKQRRQRMRAIAPIPGVYATTKQSAP
ncbi:MAG: hypothetical protein AAF657_28595, partial [Acidobacteriota bacterium]